MGGWRRWFTRQMAEIREWWSDSDATRPPTLVKVVLIGLFVILVLWLVG